MKWIIPIIAVMLLITACSTGTTQEQKNDTPQVVEEPQTHVQEVEKYPLPSVEIRMDENDFFEPNTIVVLKGETLRLHFINDEPYVFSIPALGITEFAGNGGYIDIKGEKIGQYSFECSDCKEKHTGVLKVI